VTASVLLDMPTRQRAFPQIFNRLVVILALQAHLYALVVIVGSTASYRSLPACLALWACRWPCRPPASPSPAGPAALPTVPFLAASVVLVASTWSDGRGAAARPGYRAMWNWASSA